MKKVILYFLIQGFRQWLHLVMLVNRYNLQNSSVQRNSCVLDRYIVEYQRIS